MTRSRAFFAIALSVLAALPSTAHASASSEWTKATGVIPEARVDASVNASYAGTPTALTLGGETYLHGMSKNGKGTIIVTSRWSVTSRGCSAPSYSLANGPIGATASTRCVDGNAVTEVVLVSRVSAKAPSNSAGVICSLFQVPFTAPKGSKFVSIKVNTTVTGSTRSVTLVASKSLPQH